MLTKHTLRAVRPGQWARIIVPHYERWQKPDYKLKAGAEIDVCVIPSYEPKWDYPRHWDWFYRAAWKWPGRDYVETEDRNGYRFSTHDFGMQAVIWGPSENWDTQISRDFHDGRGLFVYRPASDDPEVCPGGDWSRYECSLCGKFVKPFSNDEGNLLCPWCEVTGLVILDDEQLDRLERVRDFARSMGLSKQLEQQVSWLADYGRSTDRPSRQCVLGYDFAPHSFSFAHYLLPDSTGDGKRQFSFNGALIFQGPSCPADGSFPSLCVSLASGTGWFCHT